MATKASKKFLMEESLRIAVQKQIECFLADDDQPSLQFPASLTSTQRGFIHKYVQTKGLKSKSHGKGDNRCLTIYKPNTNTHISYDAKLELSMDSTTMFKNFIRDNNMTDIEMLVAQESENYKLPQHYGCGFAVFKLTNPPHVYVKPEINDTRSKLPITSYRDEIISKINSNSIIVISGDTGSGKTTQVPQYILEDSCARNKTCRILCTQPRRIAAVSMADRVAYERGEVLGGTVGYQIRLESKICPSSNLIYTTSGFLLRCMISDASAKWLSRITHIVMDEVHERDRYTDFLFIVVKEALKINPTLKIILMSATIDTNVFTTYFDCPLLKIPGRMHAVHIYQLEDVLGMVGYFDSQIKSQRSKKSAPTETQMTKSLPITTSIDDDRRELIDETLQECFHGRSDFDQFFYLVSGEGVDVNVKHSDTDLNALLIAAINGLPDIIQTLLQMGADPTLVGGFGYTAKEWALQYGHSKCVEILEQAEAFNPDSIADEEKRAENQKRLQLYLDQTNETEIDHVLLFNTIKHIHEHMSEGSILVFLPGYDTITEQMNAILEGDIGSNIEILFLHGNMETSDQRRVFSKAAPGCRKIILSTNIAETSLTIDDVVYVIDCGKVKQISYDSLSESTSLTSTWISKACAKQRMGRAGRTSPGICFRLYSEKRFVAMEEFTLPELLRIPLTELCLHARIMTKTSIADYLSKAIQPPAASAINQSIRLLKTIGALDEDENVTELGYRLVDLPVDVQLGKMLLYSILMKCLDPVITIISSLSVKDPFVLNFENENQSTLSRKTLAENCGSDLLVFIKLYQMWLESKSKGNEYQFCRENHVSNGIMELINGFRAQVLGQLRTVGFVTPRGAGDMTDLNQNSNNFAVIKACFVAGFYPNVCRVDRKVGNLKSKQEKKLLPHVTSVLREKNLKSLKSILTNLPSEWIVFGEKSRVERLSLVRNNTVVSALTIALFCGPMHIPKQNIISFDDSDSENDEADTINTKFILDDWIYFILSEDAAQMIHRVRLHLSAMFMKTLADLHKKSVISTYDSKIVDVIAAVLEVEDEIGGFKKPENVGTRPILFSTKMRWQSRSGTDTSNTSSSSRAKSVNRNYQPKQAYTNALGISLYRKNEPVEESNSSDQSLHDFEQFVSSYKCEMQLKPKVRYFIVRTDCKDRILTAYKMDRNWQFSQRLLKHFKSARFRLDETDILLFFLTSKLTFYTVGRMKSNGHFLNVENFNMETVSSAEVRYMMHHNFPDMKHIDKYKNGEELLNTNCADQLLRLFLRKSFLNANR
ncbi:3'-5' RNA helicase YTHDC2 [Pseudolycoriella hygida]|uniref:3'-5' RNA helicase YTHDC2 n=1 Tax=Pseudolycoriella hygida TaxID=35572 RepID=A0A9Q0RXH6_9DIPT|nr:3'-5' RNA helicase YTHDC2 [Pseudolycoriella hygida]